MTRTPILVKNRWQAFHVFYHGDIDTLLLDCVGPLIHRLRRERIGGEYFFVRYWNGGPHLRLRIRPMGDPDTLHAAVLTALGDFLRGNPAGRSLSHEDYAQQMVHMQTIHDSIHVPEPSEPLQPADSVQSRDYAFDAFRYGRGSEAEAISEGHFCRASEMAMYVIAQTRGNMDARMTLGLYLTAALASALDVETEHAASLFSKATGLLKILYPAESGDILSSQGFPNYEQQRGQLAALLSQLRNRGTCPDHDAGLNRLLDVWRSELRSKLGRLRELRAGGETALPAEHLVALDYMHMTNNRLGIGVSHECYAYYLVANALRETMPFRKVEY
jgi:hypothetical protein